MLKVDEYQIMNTDLKKDTSHLYNIASRDKVTSLLLEHSQKIWKAGKEGQHFRHVMEDQDIATLINELQEYHHLLEMQNHELKRMEMEAEKAKINQQKAILSAMFIAQEKERDKISQSLHDSVCQLLYGIRLILQSSPLFKKDDVYFNNLNELLDKAINETRQISYELKPSILVDFGFIEGIKEIASRLSTRDFKIRTRIMPQANDLEQEVQLRIFRIIQELVNNTIKHANAKKLDISFTFQGKNAVLEVSDDGIGFQDDLSVALRSGSGLRSIKNQLVVLNGILSIEKNDVGVTVKVEFGNIKPEP